MTTTSAGGPRRAAHPGRAGALVVMIALAGVLSGCGPRGGAGRDDVSRLEVTRYRLNIDEKHSTARIMAEIHNTGDEPVREAVVTAILLGRRDEKRGENKITIRDIQPGRPKLFGMTVTTHGRERDVEFRISAPGETQAEER